jgi:hypothetical protein
MLTDNKSNANMASDGVSEVESIEALFLLENGKHVGRMLTISMEIGISQVISILIKVH